MQTSMLRAHLFWICTTFLLAAASCSEAPSVKRLDAKNGFRDDVFGKTTLDASKFYVVSRDRNEHTTTTVKLHESPSLFGVAFKDLFYIFKDGKLSMVRGHLQSREESVLKSVADQFAAEYGPATYGEFPDPTAPGVINHEYTWIGSHVYLELLRSAGSSDDPEILFLIYAMSREQQERQHPGKSGGL